MIDRHNKFIFSHIPKNAGQSIEKALGISNYRSVNYESLIGPCRDLEKFPYQPFFLQHLTLSEFKKYFQIKIEEYFCFSVIRNPWSRAVSSFVHEKKHHASKIKNCSFLEFLKNPQHVDPSHSLLQHEFLFEGEKKLFDFLIKFENLQEDFNKVCQILNIPKKILPKENSGNKKHYKEYYNSESFDIVSEKFSKDIETFNYKFE